MGLGVTHALAQVSGGSVGYHRIGGWTAFDLRLPTTDAATTEDQGFIADAG
jgi:hypothetical protein